MVIVESKGYDPFQEGAGGEEEDTEAGYEATSGPRASRRSEEHSPYWVIWTVLRSILEILLDVVI